MSQVKQFIKEQIKTLAFKNAGDDEPLLKSKLLDSIVVVDLAVAIEEKYQIKIPFTEINSDNFETITAIVNFLERKGIVQ